MLWLLWGSSYARCQGISIMAWSIKAVKLRKMISGIKKQGGFARLIRGSHALEVWHPLSLKRDNLKLVLPFFVSYYLFSYSLPRASVHPLLQVKQIFSACQALFLFKWLPAVGGCELHVGLLASLPYGLKELQHQCQSRRWVEANLSLFHWIKHEFQTIDFGGCLFGAYHFNLHFSSKHRSTYIVPHIHCFTTAYHHKSLYVTSI